MVLLFCAAHEAVAQDPYFTQNLYHTLYLNPAYAGYGSKLKTTLSYRNQWRNEELPSYRTLYVAADAKAFCFSNDSYVAFGGFALLDQEYGGMIRNTNANISVAASLKLSDNSNFESRILLGMAGGLYSRSYNLSDELLFESVVNGGGNFDPLFVDGTIDLGSRLVEDIGVGLGIQFTMKGRHSILVGASGTHLTSPALFGPDRLHRKYSANILADFTTINQLDFKIYADMALQNKAIRSHAGVLFGLVSNTSNNNSADDFGIQGGATISIVGDQDRALAFESVSPVIQLNYLFFDFIITKDINVSTRRIANQKGGMEFIMRFRISDHKIKSKERLPKLCSEPCPLP